MLNLGNSEASNSVENELPHHEREMLHRALREALQPGYELSALLPREMRAQVRESIQALKDTRAQSEEAHPLTIRHVLTDHLGTAIALVNANGEQQGQVAWAAKYTAWGQIEEEYNPNQIHQPIRFQGQQFDQETGLHYNRFRYYDPIVGSYISLDPLGLKGGTHGYIYPVDPLYMIDPLGLQKVSTFQKTPKIKQPALFDATMPQDKLDKQTVEAIAGLPPAPEASGLMSSNGKPWKSLSPHDYSMECDEWEQDSHGQICKPLDEKPGKKLGRRSSSMPPTSMLMPLPEGIKCNKLRMKVDPNARGSASTADADDILDAMGRIRLRTRGSK